MQNANDRVQQLQNAVRIQMQLGTHLEKTIVSADAKEFLLRFAMNSLSDVETFLLPQALKAQTPASESLWLKGAELTLNHAAKQLKRAEELLSKYGPDLQVIGG